MTLTTKQTVTNSLSEENIKMILNAIGFTEKNKSWNKDLEPKEGDASVIDKYNVDEESITVMNNKKISNLNGKRNNKDDEVERLLADIDSMI